MKSSHVRRNKKKASSRGDKAQQSTELTISIAALGRHGHGVSELETGRVFVPFTLPGEDVRAKVTGDRGEAIEIIKASNDRINSTCSYFGTCGGCSVQHLKDDAYQSWKRDIVLQALRHKGLDTNIEPMVIAHGDGRRRVTFHAQRHGSDIRVGFMQARSHRLSNIDSCPVLEPLFVDSVKLVRDLAQRLGVSGRGLDVQLTASETGLDCNVIGASSIGYDHHMLLAETAENYDLARLALNGDIISERRKPQITIGLTPVPLPIGGFLQATQEGERVLSELVCGHALDMNARSVADLFCGVGPYALHLAEHMPVLAVDNNLASVKCLSDALRHASGLKPVEALTRDLFENPVSVGELEEFDCVIFNPPRAGAKEQAESIADSSVPNVIAVSCEPSTFARDARLLVEGGYSLDRVIPVDQFKWAAHVEVIGMFTRQ